MPVPENTQSFRPEGIRRAPADTGANRPDTRADSLRPDRGPADGLRNMKLTAAGSFTPMTAAEIIERERRNLE